MGDFTFESQGMDTYFVYHLEKGERIDSFAKGMLQNNEISGILSPSFIQKDEEQYLKYNITSRMPLNEYFREKTSKSRVIAIFRSILKGMKESEEYMLMPEGFLLKMDCIYVDISSREARLLYLPLEKEKEKVILKEFYKSMLLHINYDEQENMGYIGRLINYLNKEKEIDIEEFDRFLEKQEKSQENSEAVLLKTRNPQWKAVPKGEEEQSGSLKSVCPASAASALQENSPVQPVYKPSAQPIYNPLESESFSIPQPTVKTVGGQKEEKKKVFSLFGGNQEKKAAKAAEKEAREAAKAAKKAAKKGGIPVLPKTPDVAGQSEVPKPPAMGNYPGVPKPPAMGNQPGIPKPPLMESQSGMAKSSVVGSQSEVSKAEIGYAAPVFQKSPDIHSSSFRGGSFDDEENRTIIIGGTEEEENRTMILGWDRENGGLLGRAVLTRKRNGQSMVINKDVFHIGKESSFADFYIGDNATISSAHADIINDEGQYLIRDMNSLNHTYVNGVLVEAGEMKKLRSGDVLRLSNEEFDFRIE